MNANCSIVRWNQHKRGNHSRLVIRTNLLNFILVSSSKTISTGSNQRIRFADFVRNRYRELIAFHFVKLRRQAASILSTMSTFWFHLRFTDFNIASNTRITSKWLQTHEFRSIFVNAMCSLYLRLWHTYATHKNAADCENTNGTHRATLSNELNK